MIRKSVLLLLVLTGIVPFACCPESPPGPYKLELVHLIPFKSNYMHPGSLQGDTYVIQPDETYQGDTLLLGLGFYSLLAHQSASVSLYGSALALSCPDDLLNYTHLQDKITSLELHSDQPYLGIPAGEPLTDHVSVYNFSDRQIISLTQAITNLNTLKFNEGMNMGLGNLVLTGKPDEVAVRTFTVRIAYESGLEQTVTSIPVRW